jgi:hypothetical protein
MSVLSIRFRYYMSAHEGPSSYSKSCIFGYFSHSKLLHYAHSPQVLLASFPTSKNPHKNHAFTTNCPHISCWKKHNSRTSPPKIPEQNQTRSPKSLKLTTIPKNRFIHKKVVSPPLLTFVSPEAPFDRPRVPIDEILANPLGRRVRSSIPLVSTPELRPRHPRRPAHKNIGVILALLVLHAFRIAVMSRQRTGSK